MANERAITPAAIPAESAPAPAPPSGGFGQDTRVNVNSDSKSMLYGCFGAEWTSMEEGALSKLANSRSRKGPPVVSLARKVGCEFIGTLMLIFAATAIAILFPNTQESDTLLIVAIATGLTVMMIIFSTGHISGAHLNPAVTIAFAAVKHFPWRHVPAYIAAQLLGSLCASFALKVVLHPITGSGGVTVPAVPYGQAFAWEFIVTFILMFVNCAVATDTRAVGELAGIAVGATVMLNNFIAGPRSGASMNPVRTLGPAVAANNFTAIWIYFVAPPLGSLFGAAAYSAIKLPEDDDVNRDKPIRNRSFSRS